MLESESLYIRELLKRTTKQKILNLCSSDYDRLRRYQPHSIKNLIKPLIRQRNTLHNLDMRKGPGVDTVCDCQDMSRSVKDESYNIVLFFNSIEHLLKPHDAVAEIHRVLKSKGVCYASAPAKDYPYHEDPIDTMLRMSTLQDWRAFFAKDKWEILKFKLLKEYREIHHRIDGVTVIKAVKL